MSQVPDESTRRIMDGTAWSEFCDALKAAGKIVLDPKSPQNAFDRAEGFRYLSRLVRAGLETCVEDADPQAPELLRTCHETVKIGADNPDNLYQNAHISGKYEYRVSGTRGSVHYLGFGTYEGNYGLTGALEPTGYLDDSKIEVGADGRFEMIVSTKPHPGNWLPMAERSRSFVVRQTFLDRKHETPADLRIERIDGLHAPRPLTPRALSQGLRAAGLFVGGTAQLFNQWATGFEKHKNQLPKFDQKTADSAGGVPHIVYYHSYWELAPSEALVIDVRPPDCDYWNFQLNNHWMESLDYRYFKISVNKHTAKQRTDGSVRIIIAHEDPGVDNFIDTCGHERGTMCLRWVRATEHPQPETHVAKLSELRAAKTR
jgi:hypothetical protein